MHLRWGATNEEVKAKMPGDEIVKSVHFNANLSLFPFPTMPANDRGYGHPAVCGRIHCRPATR